MFILVVSAVVLISMIKQMTLIPYLQQCLLPNNLRLKSFVFVLNLFVFSHSYHDDIFTIEGHACFLLSVLTESKQSQQPQS